jgi:hypothetical protein
VRFVVARRDASRVKSQLRLDVGDAASDTERDLHQFFVAILEAEILGGVVDGSQQLLALTEGILNLVLARAGKIARCAVRHLNQSDAENDGRRRHP